MVNSASITSKNSKKRGRRGRRGRDGTSTKTDVIRAKPVSGGMTGGRFSPLTADDITQIDGAVRTILGEIGFADVPQIMWDVVLNGGGRVSKDGRLLFPEPLLNTYLESAQRDFSLYGQVTGHEIDLSGKRVYMGTGGAAPQVVDLETGLYRDSVLQDLYDAARLVDTLEHIHFFSRSLVARDMPDSLSLDVNTAYASLLGTKKHVMTSISVPENVAEVAELCFMLAGSPEAFAARPFVSLNINHVVPPLRFDEPSCQVMAEAVKLGIPVHANVFGQVGASSPVTLAAAVAQSVAESLAGMIFAWLIDPTAKVIMGCRPMITDLRTGGIAGGSGESALIMGATTQMAHHYNLPNSCIAGGTDSKIADAQSGYEKGLTVTLAAQAGSNLITQSCGMHAGLMSVAFESYVLDNDMLGGILRTLRPIEVNSETLATEIINEVVRGEGHFLGHPETYKRMQSDFLYPQVADRRSPAEWEKSGGKDIREMARERAREVLGRYTPNHLPADLDKQIRGRFNIRLEQI